ncbi:hypothetical protein K493DRAFT_304987 [Basidiobolus meristosporus CBS 931.73]|uniref:Uncharacterized protein n=1 Tax=Basidiobolus meristosporus CBS 931.73 TaxID=1314790 RepID=A0A1Y1XX34_9FUNG|nr:hypothetical protein K493DRAFT_304987 [Basidiobolus meristosporus CBS 931.73]|eukprot:ORX90311.1 hypothetical protein K493DRAFT_304987 [Basidiobolus meristosporus CBS 931.73]
MRTFPILCLLVSIPLSHAAIPDLSKFRDREPDVVHELKELHNKKIRPVVREVARDIIHPEFDATKALKRLNQMKAEYHSEGRFLLQRYSSQAQHKKTELHRVNEMVTSEIQRVARLLWDSVSASPYLTMSRLKNETHPHSLEL